MLQLLPLLLENHNTVAHGGNLTHKTETYKTNTVGEKTTKLGRIKVGDDLLGRLLISPIFVVQMTAALTNSYIVRRHATSPKVL